MTRVGSSNQISSGRFDLARNERAVESGERAKTTAGPSTSFGAKDAPNYKDDSSFIVRFVQENRLNRLNLIGGAV